MEIRRFSKGEGARFRELRLRALRDAPFAFASWFERERGRTLSEWEAIALGNAWDQPMAVFVAADGDQWLGMAGGYLDGDRPGVAGLWGMWVAPEARRQGLDVISSRPWLIGGVLRGRLVSNFRSRIGPTLR